MECVDVALGWPEASLGIAVAFSCAVAAWAFFKSLG
jgi:hypothetical protein